MSEFLATFAQGFSLHEALAILEDDSTDFVGIALFPPTNANADVTDEDSGEEDNVDINNLPASQMNSGVEVFSKYNGHDEWDSDDDIPLSEVKKSLPKKKNLKKRKQYHYVKEDVFSADAEFINTDEVFDLAEHSPTALFYSIFDDELFEILTRETNRYAAQRNRTLQVDIFEMKCFIGVLLISGYIPIPRRRMFWERSKDCSNELVYEAISRNKFEFIISNIHCNDNNSLDQSDKFSKVRPLFTHLNKKFIEAAYTEENHSVDEAMVPYTGRHGCKQYIHGKPIRYGYKLWVGTTRQGYINWFEPYQGASTNISEIYKDLGVGASVVLEYADVLRSKWKDQHFHLYFDNFFSSISLLEQLTNKQIFGTGTMRENRIPGSTLTDSKNMKKSARGSYDFIKIADSNIIFIKWNDNNIVTFCSNAIGMNPINLTILNSRFLFFLISTDSNSAFAHKFLTYAV